jgi:nucleoside-diphosphate-sugar epimerase
LKVLITGGAGYIGSVLSRQLINRGYDVTILDTFFFGEDSIKDIRDRVKVVKGDIRDVGAEVFDGIDAVINMAAISNDPSGELRPELTESINHLGRSRTVQLSKKMGVKRHIIASSCSIYGFTEGIADETSKSNPLTIYAKANEALEKEALALADKNFCVTSLRQATVYGLSYRMRFDLMVNTMMLQLWQRRGIPTICTRAGYLHGIYQCAGIRR